MAKIQLIDGGNSLLLVKDDNTEVQFTAAQIEVILNGMGTDDIANGAVTAAKLATNAVETEKVKDGAITAGKTATAVQASLGKADSAVQPASIVNVINALAAGVKVASGVANVTGSADVDTGLATVTKVIVSLGVAPDANTALVAAVLGGTAGHVTITAYKFDGDAAITASTTATAVHWIAYGT
jgi:hypothetical protein